MSLLGNMRLAWKERKALRVSSAAIDAVKEAYVKDGIKTTEFWMTLLTNVISVVSALNGVLDPKTATIVLAVANGLYGILRTITKATSPAVVAVTTAAPTA